MDRRDTSLISSWASRQKELGQEKDTVRPGLSRCLQMQQAGDLWGYDLWVILLSYCLSVQGRAKVFKL